MQECKNNIMRYYDFFNIRPKHSTLFGFRSMDMSGMETRRHVLPSFDVVVANPICIRQELLGEDEKAKIKGMIQSHNRKT